MWPDSLQRRDRPRPCNQSAMAWVVSET